MSVGNFDNFMHTVYEKPGTIEDMAVRDRPGLALISKGQAEGKTTGVSFKLSPPQGLASARVDAQLVSAFPTTNGSNAVVGEWLMTNGTYSPTVELDDKQMDESEASGGAAYARKFVTETDGLIESFGDVMDTYIFGERGKSVGSGTLSSNTFTITSSLEDINNFFVGMAVVPSAADGSTSTDDILATAIVGYISSVNRDAGTMTIGTAPGTGTGTLTGWTGTMFLFRAGDFQGDGAGGSGTQVGQQIIESLADWVPATAPSDTFKTVNRGLDTRLGGTRLTATEATNAGTIEGRFKKLAVKIQQVCGQRGTLTFVCETEQWQALADILESRSSTSIVERKYEGKSGREGSFNFTALRMATNAGMAEIISDSHVKHTIGWALNLKHIQINSVGGFPAVFKGDGLKMLRKSNSDRYEFRLKCYAHLCMRYPGFNGRTPLVAIT